MKDKRSFFERLTGTVRVEDELMEEEETPVETKHHHTSGHHLKVREQDLAKDADWPEPEEGEGQLTVDVYQTSDDIYIRTLVAGVDPNDLDISITRDRVTIKGKREGIRDIEDENYFHRELYWGGFTRTVDLPEEIDVEEAEASQKHGLLTIRLPKVDKSRQTKLKVKVM
jgi:HSP20 family molecular chaperone IbpA